VGEPLLLKTPLKLITPLCGWSVPLFAKLWIVVVPVATLLRNVPALLNGWLALQQCW
jgi:hypothetical protein